MYPKDAWLVPIASPHKPGCSTVKCFLLAHVELHTAFLRCEADKSIIRDWKTRTSEIRQ